MSTALAEEGVFFKPVVGFENYLVTDDGRVWSKAREIEVNGVKRTLKGKWLKPLSPKALTIIRATKSTERLEPELESHVRIKVVPGCSGAYAVTDDGRVWSYARCVQGTGGKRHSVWGKWLTPYHNFQNRPSVRMLFDVGSKMMRVHSLVAEAFLGPRPKKHDVDHIDRNPLNNHISNLRYVTRSQNAHNNKYKGYCFDKETGRYRAYMTEMKVRVWLGRYDTPEEAREAHIAEKKRRGLYTP